MSAYASIDFETYSEAGFSIDPATGKVKGLGAQGKGGLPVVNTPVYAADNSAEILCLCYDLHEGAGVQLWLPTDLPPIDLLHHVRRGGLVEAWNVTFEFWFWNTVCVRRHNWPTLNLAQCRCAMARSRAYSMPGSLAVAAKVFGGAQKGSEGGTLIRKLTRPHTPTKDRPAIRWTPLTAPEDFAAFYDYCGGDVIAEDATSAHLPELSDSELATWQIDQVINLRGVRVDVQALDDALEILKQTEQKYTRRLSYITDERVQSVSEIASYVNWIYDQGVPIPDMTKDTVAEFLGKDDLPAAVREALDIRASLGAANVKKLRSLKLQTSSDGRLRNQYVYCGADRTGRWSAAGVQLQNFTAQGPKVSECGGCGKSFGTAATLLACPRCGCEDTHAKPDWTAKDVSQAIEDISYKDLAHVEAMWGPQSIAVLCGCLRGLLVSKPGHRLVCCDYSAIEAVVAACLSRCQWRIDIFSTHGLIYEQSAANATGIPFEEIVQYKKDHGRHHPARKGVGKIRELAGSYGGWIGAWKNFGAEGYFDSDEEIKQDVLKWRDESPEIITMWGGQYKWCGPGKWDYRAELHGLEGAVIQAILSPGQAYQYIDITYIVLDNVLQCLLPSGRRLNYHQPELQNGVDKLDRGPSYTITFMGYNTNTAKGPRGWIRMDTYGGRLFENVVQAVARDLQAGALKRCENAGYPIVMHTHDDDAAEVPMGVGSVEEMCAIMVERPDWASWWPIRATGWEHHRYQ